MYVDQGTGKVDFTPAAVLDRPARLRWTWWKCQPLMFGVCLLALVVALLVIRFLG